MSYIWPNHHGFCEAVFCSYSLLEGERRREADQIHEADPESRAQEVPGRQVIYKAPPQVVEGMNTCQRKRRPCSVELPASWTGSSREAVFLYQHPRCGGLLDDASSPVSDSHLFTELDLVGIVSSVCFQNLIWGAQIVIYTSPRKVTQHEYDT